MRGTAEGADASPPWNWSRLPPGEVDEAWRELAAWVEDLRREYRAWIALPECWPLHEPLRSELLYFMYWQQRLIQLGEDPEDGVRWHTELRRSAESWARLASCDHGVTGRWAAVRGEEQRRAVLSRNLLQAINDWRARPR